MEEGPKRGRPKIQVCKDGKVRATGRPPLPVTNCMTPGCTMKTGGDHKGGRGLCKRCHSGATSLVRRKVTTWEELERLHLAQPRYVPLVELALLEARKQKEGDDANTSRDPGQVP